MGRDEKLIGYCGLYCGACNHYLAGKLGGAHLLKTAHSRGYTRAEFVCEGCRSDSLCAHPHCARCAIRDCALDHGARHCGECSEMPCRRLEAFRDDGHDHHLGIVEALRDLTKMGPRNWLSAQDSRWTCACGSRLSWVEESCPACGRPSRGLSA